MRTLFNRKFPGVAIQLYSILDRADDRSTQLNMLGAWPIICENDLPKDLLKPLPGVSVIRVKIKRWYMPEKSGRLGMAKPSFLHEHRLISQWVR